MPNQTIQHSATKPSRGGARKGAGRPKGSGKKIKISVSVDMANWKTALSGWASPSLLVDHLVSNHISNNQELDRRNPRNAVNSGLSKNTNAIAEIPAPSSLRNQQPTNAHNSIDALTQREREVLQLLASGDLYKEIADTLGIRITTVNAHVRRIYAKLAVRSRGQAVAKFAHHPPSASHP